MGIDLSGIFPLAVTLPRPRRKGYPMPFLKRIYPHGGLRPEYSSYTKVYSVIYDSGSVPRRVIFSPRETPAEAKKTFRPTNPESIIKCQLARCNYLQDPVWCKYGHVTRGYQGEQTVRSPPCDYSEAGLSQRREIAGYLVHKKQRPPGTLQQDYA